MHSAGRAASRVNKYTHMCRNLLRLLWGLFGLWQGEFQRHGRKGLGRVQVAIVTGSLSNQCAHIVSLEVFNHVATSCVSTQASSLATVLLYFVSLRSLCASPKACVVHVVVHGFSTGLKNAWRCVEVQFHDVCEADGEQVNLEEPG